MFFRCCSDNVATCSDNVATCSDEVATGSDVVQIMFRWLAMTSGALARISPGSRQAPYMTSKQKLNEALKNNICGKVTRELKKGSLEVYPINGYGAVEMGLHAFHNNKEPSAPSHYSKFVRIWKKEKGKWQITRVISLH